MDEKDFFRVKRKRPEDMFKDSEEFFKGEKISQYASSKAMMRIQHKITLRAIELLDIKKKKALILDAGSGPGFSSAFIKELGFKVVSLDINKELLNHYKIRELNPIVGDIRSTPFRSEIFDAIISISVIQWIFQPPITKTVEKGLIMMLNNFYAILKDSSKAAFQYYPKSSSLIEKMGEIIKQTTRFEGGFIIDNPNIPKKRKVFLLLKKRK